MDNVVVTGASRGIGLAIARALARSGYRVLAIARTTSPDFLEAAQRTVDQGQGEIRFIPFDLANVNDLASLVTDMRREFGPIYGLVNNAAVSSEGLLATMPNAQIEDLLKLNTLSPIILTKYVVRGMMSEGRGRIVNISSIVASTGYRALSVYAASKASLIGFTKSLAREVGQLGITVNAIAPGFMVTEMTNSLDAELRARIVRRSPLRRLAEADDAAAAVEYLLGEKARNITGAVITIDAGATA